MRNMTLIILILVSLPCFAEITEKTEVLKVIRAEPKCDADTLQSVSKDFKIEADIITEAAKSGCLNPILGILPPLPKDVSKDELYNRLQLISEAGKNYIQFVESEVMPITKEKLKAGDNPVLTDKEWYSLGNSLQLFQALAKKICDPSSPTNKTLSICSEQSRLKNLFADLGKMSKQEQENSKKASVEKFPSEACPLYWNVKAYEKALNHEKEIVRVSGTGNIQHLNQYGQAVVSGREQLETLQKAYQKQTGKTYKYESCPSKYNRLSGTLLNGE
jgi:hypothetical protein